MDRLQVLVGEKLTQFPAQAAMPFLPLLLQELGDRANAIVIYGSCLHVSTRSETSMPDFYVVVPSYRRFYGSFGKAFSNWILPPNIFHIRKGSLDAKYNVISERDLAQATSDHARDVYHLGRFSKRIAIAWARDEHAKEMVARAQASAMRAVAHRIYFSITVSFQLSDFIRQALNLSYLGEFRVEAPDKIDRLYEAEKKFYDQAYGLILGEMAGNPWQITYDEKTTSYQKPSRLLYDLWGRFWLWRLVRRSRWRAKFRWPKSIFTVPNWIDYLLAKIERTHGIKIHLTEKERRYVFIYGWKYFFLLRKKNALK